MMEQVRRRFGGKLVRSQARFLRGRSRGPRCCSLLSRLDYGLDCHGSERSACLERENCSVQTAGGEKQVAGHPCEHVFRAFTV